MVSAIVVAGGAGERFGQAGGKQMIVVDGLPLLAHALLAFERCARVGEVVLVTHPDRVDEYRRETVEAASLKKVGAVVGGGMTRQESVANGLSAMSSAASIVAIHDGARPLVTPAVITSAIDVLERSSDLDGVVVGHPSYDTMKVVGSDGVVIDTPDRSTLWVVQTPQVFRAARLRDAYEGASTAGFVGTDDASLVEWFGGRVGVVLGPRDNVKVTVAEDLAYVRAVLAARKGEA